VVSYQLVDHEMFTAAIPEPSAEGWLLLFWGEASDQSLAIVTRTARPPFS
jgi:hypothetical protein